MRSNKTSIQQQSSANPTPQPSANNSVHLTVQPATTCSAHNSSQIVQVCLNQYCDNRKMCANCSHPNCDATKAKLIKEFIGMIKQNMGKDEATKLVYYDSGDYLKDFKDQFIKLAERQRASVNEQFDTLVKLIEGISQQPLVVPAEIQLFKICQAFEKCPEEVILENFDIALKIAADKQFIKSILQQRSKMKDSKSSTLQAYENDMKILEGQWSSEFLKLKEKYFLLVNQKQDAEHRSSQLILAFGENIAWVNDLGNKFEQESFQAKVSSWKVDWDAFKRVEIDDVSVNDYIKSFNTDFKNRLLLTKTSSGPVFSQLIKSLISNDPAKSENTGIEFSIQAVIIEITKDKHVELLRTISSYNVPILGIHLSSNSLSEKTLAQFGQNLATLKKTSNVVLDVESSLQNPSYLIHLAIPFKDISQITQLDLNFSRNKLKKENLEHLGLNIKMIKLLVQLKLNLQDNEIGEEGCQAFAIFLPEFSALQSLELNLWSNNIKEVGAKYLGLALKSMNKQVTSIELILCYNNIGDKGIQHISMSLPNFKVLNVLKMNLWNNSLGSKGATNLGNSLSSMTSLKTLELNLWFNDISENGVVAIAKNLSHLGVLVNLDLNFSIRANNIFEKEIKVLVDNLQNLENLRNASINLMQQIDIDIFPRQTKVTKEILKSLVEINRSGIPFMFTF